MINKHDVQGAWDVYITEYKDLRRKISNLLDTERPLPYEHFKNIFGDTDDSSIRSAYAEWVRQTNSKLHVIVEKNGLCYYPSWTHYQVGLQELAYGDKFENFVVRMGAWCLGDRFDKCIPDGVSIDELSLDDIVKYCYGNGEVDVDYTALYNAIEVARGQLSFRLKDSELKQAIKECDEVLRNAIEDCSKHMESVYKERYNEALHLLEQLSGNAQYMERVEFMNKLLCHGQFDSWYYNGTHGQGDSILNIIGYVEILRNPERLDQI